MLGHAYLAVHHPVLVTVWCLVSIHLLARNLDEPLGHLPPAAGYLHSSGEQDKVHHQSGYKTLTVHLQQGLQRKKREKISDVGSK